MKIQIELFHQHNESLENVSGQLGSEKFWMAIWLLAGTSNHML